MSLGYVGKCNKISEDEKIVIYSYAGENWNDNGKSKQGDRFLQDGRFIIYKECLEIKKAHITVTKHIIDGKIIIEKECKNAFRRDICENISIDYIAYILLTNIFKKYQEEGNLPETEAFIQ